MKQGTRYGLLVMIFFVITILLTPSVISADFDNVKSYDTDSKTYTITGSYGLGSSVAEITLDRNDAYCEFECSAQGTITLYTKQSIFDSIIYYNVGGSVYDSSPDVTVYYRSSDAVVDVADGGVVSSCITYASTTAKNGTIEGGYDVCEYSVNDTKISVKDESWTEYDGSELSAGDYDWKIIGSKLKGESVDWVTEMMGVELTDWAVWDSYPNEYYLKGNMTTGTGNLVFLANGTGLTLNEYCYVSGNLNTSDSVVAYLYYDDDIMNFTFGNISNNAIEPYFCEDGVHNYSLNTLFTTDESVFSAFFHEGAGTSTMDIVKNKSITLTNTPTWITNISAPFGYALHFDRVSTEYGAWSQTLCNDDTGYSISLWTVPDVDSNTFYLIDDNDVASMYIQAYQIKGFQRHGAGAYIPSTAFTVTNGDLYHVVLTYDSTDNNLTLYVNGTLIASDSGVNDGSACSGVTNIGRRTDGNHYYKGIIDNVRTWNRTLSTNEIVRLYQQNADSYNTHYTEAVILDTTPPTVAITFPENNSNITQSTQYVNVSFTADENVTCNITLNSVVYVVSGTAGTLSRNILVGTENGTVQVNVTCLDSSNNSGFSGNHYFLYGYYQERFFLSGGTCPNNTTDNIYMFGIIVFILFGLIMVNQTYIRMSMIDILIGISWVFIGGVLAGCHVIIGGVVILFGVLYMMIFVLKGW